MSAPVQLSLCITTRGKEWLLARTVHWLARQKVAPDINWELIVVDDCSPVPIDPFLQPLRDAGVNVRSFRLEHNDGWRGITAGMRFAFEQADGLFVAETNSHLLLPANSVNLLYLAHVDPAVRQVFCRTNSGMESWLTDNPDKLWVSLRPFNLTTEATINMDQVLWREEVSELWALPETEDAWTRLWTDHWDGMAWKAGDNAKQLFGTHLCCSIRKDTFLRVDPWPKEGFKDYGTDDPAYAGARQRQDILDLNVWMPEDAIAHLAHNTHMEDAMELVPTHLNKHGHTRATARLWDPPAEREDRPTFNDVIQFWESGQRTTDWRVREGWGWSNPPAAHYIELAFRYRRKGLVYLEEMFGEQLT